MVVAAADHYRLLGVARDATREQIAQAWRRRARSEHPDRRPGEAGDEAAARFRELAEAYRVLGDPVRRVAYDRILASGQPAARMPPGVPVPVRVIRPDAGTAAPRPPDPPLRAGPVLMEGPLGTPGSGLDEDEIRRAVVAALAFRQLRRTLDQSWRKRGWP
jgi:curved DNA-binding protein CbpA